jgi:hypothetical protein
MDGDVWSLANNESTKPAITTTNVKHGGIPRVLNLNTTS